MKFLIFLLSFFSLSCAKLGYITEQGIGQVSLEWNGLENEKVLMDPNVSVENKRQVELIESYKNYFYDYFQKERTDIYDETTFLKTEAVTYLVIVSPKNKIEALSTSFPIVGSFPYLGFFKKESALAYKEEKMKEGFSTYIRPVYAYSTLNQWIFNDNILSSFFQYNDEDLAELIFHELTHTILFIKDEVDFNESLADYIGRHLSFEYFKKSKEDIIKWKKLRSNSNQVLIEISHLALELNSQYEKSNDYNLTLNSFINSTFKPKIKKLCERLKVKNCWPLKSEWNNARFAGFLTYHKEQNLIEKLVIKKKFNLKDLLGYIEKTYNEYDSQSKIKSFTKFIIQKEQI